jgi:hypothetical protein
MVTPTKA